MALRWNSCWVPQVRIFGPGIHLANRNLVNSSQRQRGYPDEARCYHMSKCRAFMSWYFCFYSVVLLVVTILAIWSAVQGQVFNHLFGPLLRFVLVYASFLLAAVVFGKAWWAVWSRKNY